MKENELENIISGENPNSNVTLEIGAGRMSILNRSGERLEQLKKNPKDRYIGVDLCEKDLARSKEIIESWFGDDGDLINKIFLMVARGEKLPLKNGSANEIVVSNVFGEPVHRPGDDCKKILEEIHRVLKEKGILKIIETASPEVAMDGNWLLKLIEGKFKLINKTDSENYEQSKDIDKKVLKEPGSYKEKSFIKVYEKISEN